MKTLSLTLAFAGVLAVGGCRGARLDSFLYAPVTTDNYDLQTYLGYQEVTFPSTDNVTIHAMIVQGPRPYTLIYCHGQGGDITDSWSRIELLAPLGYTMLIWDYRGFGRSTGTPSESGIHDDEEALWNFLQPMIGNDKLIYYGRSFGGGPCIDLAARHPPSTLITESAFTSVDALIQDGALVDLPPSFVANDSWNNLARIPNIKSPFLALHGTADDYVQPKYSVELTDAHVGLTKLVLVPGANHDTVPDKMGDDDYRATVDGWVTKPGP